MIRPKCKSPVPPGAVACQKCGAKFETKACPHCKSEILFSAAVCPRCRKPVGQAAGQVQQAAAPAKGSRGSFRWWRIPIYIVIFLIGIGVGSAYTKHSILSNVKSAFSQSVSSSSNPTNSQSVSAPPAKAEDASSQEQGSEEPVSSKPEETSAASDYYFADNVLVSEDVRIEITDWKVIPAGETGNEYGDAPVIAFWYSTTNLTGKESVSPMTSWIAMFTAIQDNNPNLVNKLNVASLPDQAFLETQMATIKKGGTVDCAVAYTLSDTTTPVTLNATRGLLGEDLGKQTFNIAE